MSHSCLFITYSSNTLYTKTILICKEYLLLHTGIITWNLQLYTVKNYFQTSIKVKPILLSISYSIINKKTNIVTDDWNVSLLIYLKYLKVKTFSIFRILDPFLYLE